MKRFLESREILLLEGQEWKQELYLCDRPSDKMTNIVTWAQELSQSASASRNTTGNCFTQKDVLYQFCTEKLCGQWKCVMQSDDPVFVVMRKNRCWVLHVKDIKINILIGRDRCKSCICDDLSSPRSSHLCPQLTNIWVKIPTICRYILESANKSTSLPWCLWLTWLGVSARLLWSLPVCLTVLPAVQKCPKI